MKNLLTREEAAAYLHLGPRGADWLKRHTKDGPVYVRLGRVTLYRVEDLDNWFAALPRRGAICDLSNEGNTDMSECGSTDAGKPARHAKKIADDLRQKLAASKQSSSQPRLRLVLEEA